MNIKEFDYILPANLIAQIPLQQRDDSRLLVLDKATGKIEHKQFTAIITYLEPGDVLVLNNSKVFPARLHGRKESGGTVEIFLNHEIDNGLWEVLGKRLRNAESINFDGSVLSAKIISKEKDIYKVKFNLEGERFYAELEKIGKTPLPPYIKSVSESDKTRYQTVYAKKRGSVAAPTAGLHFTDNLLSEIEKKGINVVYLSLHVGLGTFAPVKADEIEEHKIHEEQYSVTPEVLKTIIQAKKNGRKIYAVGTTTTRVLEHLFSTKKIEELEDAKNEFAGWTNIFIYPGYKFHCVDGLVTNFHLPKSTLLMLISAFAGREKIFAAYQEAIDKKYRFFSYGDAMLIT